MQIYVNVDNYQIITELTYSQIEEYEKNIFLKALFAQILLHINEDEFLPGATIFTIKFKNGFFDTIYVENLLLDKNRMNIIEQLIMHL